MISQFINCIDIMKVFISLLTLIFIVLSNADQYNYSNNNTNTKFNDEFKINFPVGIWINKYTQIVPTNISFNAEISNNYSNVYIVTIPLIMWGKMYIGHSEGTHNGFGDPNIDHISFKSQGESYINYTIEVNCYNRTWWDPKYTNSDTGIIIICSIFGGLLLIALCILVIYIDYKYREGKRKRKQYELID
jgi:hypothetical protein